MNKSMMWLLAGELGIAAALIASPVLTGAKLGVSGFAAVGGSGPMRAFANKAELAALLAKREAAAGPTQYFDMAAESASPAEGAADASAAAADASADAAAAAPGEPPPPPELIPVPSPSVVSPTVSNSSAANAPTSKSADGITNTQTAGVDEGGIVKKQGDLLIVLRRGRLFTIDTSNRGMRKVAAVNAFPGAQDASNAWYDEMLVSNDQVIVIGYSYGRQGTEVNRFRLAADGGLTWRDTSYLRSGDYYSSRNYASRLIGDKLIFYAPLPLYQGIDEAYPALARWQNDGTVGAFRTFAEPSDIHMPAPMWANPARIGTTLHSVMMCDVGGGAMDCTARNVLGDASRNFYVSQSAVYIWTAFDPPGEYGTNAAMLYRIPLDGAAPDAVEVAGMPLDQFSFREEGDGALHVLTMANGPGDMMWGPEAADDGNMALLTIAPADFGKGDARMDSDDYRPLPSIDGFGLQNRFVGDWLLYGVESITNDLRKGKMAQPSLYAVPVSGGAPRALSPGHAVTRIDIMGRDAVVVGEDAGGSLIFSTIALDGAARLASRFAFPGAGEGENRSHAFFYRADAGGTGDSGLLGLPIRRSGGDGTRFLGNAASILFLRRDARELSEAGLLDARASDGNDNCLASCVDWYGNARPIFAGDRIFALMGYELVEGTAARGKISEKSRINFTPGPGSR